jgi:hypothetical protein
VRPDAKPETGIVLTDRPETLPAAIRPPAPCTRCGAPASRRVEACGFGARRPLICGVCGAPVDPPEAA